MSLLAKKLPILLPSPVTGCFSQSPASPPLDLGRHPVFCVPVPRDVGIPKATLAMVEVRAGLGMGSRTPCLPTPLSKKPSLCSLTSFDTLELKSAEGGQ